MISTGCKVMFVDSCLTSSYDIDSWFLVVHLQANILDDDHSDICTLV